MKVNKYRIQCANEFFNKIEALFKELGGEIDHDSFETPEMGKRWSLNTKYGIFHVSATRSTSCATCFGRFEEVERACLGTDCNPFSGKKNWHLPLYNTQNEDMQWENNFNIIKHDLEQLVQ